MIFYIKYKIIYIKTKVEGNGDNNNGDNNNNNNNKNGFFLNFGGKCVRIK